MKTFLFVLLLLLSAGSLSAQSLLYTNRITTRSVLLLPAFSDTDNRLPEKFKPSIDPNEQNRRFTDSSAAVSDGPGTPLRWPHLVRYPTTETALRKVNVNGGVKFQVVYKTATDYVIRLWNWSAAADSSNQRYNISDDSMQVYYKLPLDLVEEVSAPLLQRWSATGGVFAIPFKYRPQDGSFEPAFSVSGGAGFQLNFQHQNERTLTFLAAIGASTIALNKYNSTLPDPTKPLTAAGFTPSISIIYQFRRVQIGLPVGVDFIFDNKDYKWKNQGKPWLALSIGIGIFTDAKASEKSGDQ